MKQNCKIVDEQGVDALYSRTTDFWPESAQTCDDAYKKQVLSIIYDRLKTLADLRTMTDYFFTDPDIDVELITKNKFLKKNSEEELSALLQDAAAQLEDSDWDEDALQTTLNQLLSQTAKKPAELFSLIRISVSYAPFSPALHQTLAVLGKNTTLARLRQTITAIENH